MFAHREMQTAIKAIKEMVEEAGTTKWEWTPAKLMLNPKPCYCTCKPEIEKAYQIKDKVRASN